MPSGMQTVLLGTCFLPIQVAQMTQPMLQLIMISNFTFLIAQATILDQS